jgi:3-phosphoshikimate 1-carboxyvinyltransferase
MQFLANKPFKVLNLSKAEDTRRMVGLLNMVHEHRRSNGKEILELDTGNAGTVFRFLTALLSILPGNYLLEGSPRMLQRPVGPLVDALQTLGASIEYKGNKGYPPLLIRGKTLSGGETVMDTSLSSQFLSALLMIGPVMENGLTVHLQGKMVSFPYVKMTIALLRQMGIDVMENEKTIRVEPREYLHSGITVEPDWSAASFWYEMAALSPGCALFLPDLKTESIQGDAIVHKIFEQLGVFTEPDSRGIRLHKKPADGGDLEMDLAGYPDLVVPIAATCAGLKKKSLLRGVPHLAIKESNRLEALMQELAKLNLGVKILDDNELLTEGATTLQTPIRPLDPHGDHRIAMGLAPLAIKTGRLTILHPEVACKSYPDYWNHLENVGFDLQFND